MPVTLPGQSFSGVSFAAKLDWLINPDTAEVRAVQLDAAISDSGSGNADLVRSGLVLGKVTASGKYKQYSDAAMDGTETAVCVLLHPLWKKDVFNGALVSPIFAAAVIRGVVDGSKLVGIDANGRTDLKAAGKGFLFVDDI